MLNFEDELSTGVKAFLYRKYPLAEIYASPSIYGPANLYSLEILVQILRELKKLNDVKKEKQGCQKKNEKKE